MEWLRVLIEKINFVKLGSKCSNLQPLMSQVLLPESLGPTRDIKVRFFVEINLFITLVEVKSIVLHCNRFLFKLWIRHKSWPKVYAKKQPQIMKSITKNWTKTQIKNLNWSVPNKTTIFFQRFHRQRKFYPN